MTNNFEKLEVWKRGCQLARDTYVAFQESRDFAYRDQMIRSSLSIPSNIAEGSDRGSPKEFIRFLNIASGSSAELRTQAYIAGKLGILSKKQTQQLVTETKEISAMIQGLIRSIKATL
ncbi:MAG: four helix bundle protein [Verrucomicrobiae bacterium]|nr:four helix bundle protein [Verrucomicrobiae bacterium]NNJ41834.1 four helix bundle protein [Akkermansiaceae bacterium]